MHAWFKTVFQDGNTYIVKTDAIKRSLPMIEAEYPMSETVGKPLKRLLLLFNQM